MLGLYNEEEWENFLHKCTISIKISTACWIVSMQKSVIIVVVIVAVQQSFKRRHAKLLRAGGEMSLRTEVRNCRGDILQEGTDLAALRQFVLLRWDALARSKIK
jgi:hypothetical protein